MLDGTRVIEFEGLGPAPFAGMLFADLGAEVIVVHRPATDPDRDPERSLLDRGKKSIVLNLKSADDRDRLKRLLATADALIEGFRPGVMERLSLGPEQLRETNPRLVYGRVTGWGQDGPMARSAGHDLNYAGVAGALWYASPPGQPPFPPPTLVGDIGGGALYLVTGMLAGLLKAARTGEGTVVDAAIVDGSAHMMNLLMAAQSVGMLTRDRGESPLDGAPWSRCYACADGLWIAVQCLEPAFYAEFRRKLGIDQDPAFDRSDDPANWLAIADRLAELLAKKTQSEWSALFEGSDACVAPVLEPSVAAAHSHMAARGTWITLDGQLQARAAPRFDGLSPITPQAPPARGEHTEQVFGALEPE